MGESKPTSVTAITSRSLSVGEYIKISIDEGDILGLVERSSVSSAAFTDVKNFHELCVMLVATCCIYKSQ